ncbi:MAG: hypothetical protein MZV70_17105 [Desulfobacterales bacterium]|nr:hypothetical protein [Desulfobacterales bacterium]
MALIAPETPENERLLRQVHPPDWQNPAPAPCYNLVVIGAGTAGLICAAARGRTRRKGGADRTAPDGWRLPELWLCSFKGVDPCRPRPVRCPQRRRIRRTGRDSVQGDFGCAMERMRVFGPTLATTTRRDAFGINSGSTCLSAMPAL